MQLFLRSVHSQYHLYVAFALTCFVQNDLEYDPVLYRRDKGELDWDARSVASTAMFESPSSPRLGTAQYHASNASLTRLPGYDRYLAGGAQSQSDIELTKIDSIQEPLLHPQSYDYFQHHQGHASQQSFSPSIHPSFVQDYPVGRDREAPTHRPQERSYSSYRSEGPAYSPVATSPQQQYPPHYSHVRQDSSSNLPGRGTYGR